MIHNFPIPQNPNFIEYMYFEGGFLPHEVDGIRKQWNPESVEKASVSGESKYNEELRKNALVPIDYTELSHWVFQRIQELAIKVNYERYYFDLIGFAEPLQLMEYKEGDFFDWHLDFGPGNISTRKLSITVQLSDPDEYEGGELVFKINKEEVVIPKTKGTVVIFPSFLMHRVTPVTKGARKAIVAWIHGVPFR